MFTSLKNKIKEETGSDVFASNLMFSLPNRSDAIAFNNNNSDHNKHNNYNNYNYSNNSDSNRIVCHVENGHPSMVLNIKNGDAINPINQQQTSDVKMFASPIDHGKSSALEKYGEIDALNDELTAAESRIAKLTNDNEHLMKTIERLETSNGILEDAIKQAQSEKGLIHSEQDKIQNLQSQEISKLKSLLHFREQVSLRVISVFFLSTYS